MKKITIILSMCTILLLLPVLNTTAVNIDEELSFFNNNNIFIGDIINIDKTDEHTVFTVQYMPNGELSYITYSKSPTSNVTLTVREGEIINVLTFMINGDYLIDGQKVIFQPNSPSISPYSTYISSFSTRMPSISGSYSSFYTSSGNLKFDRAVSELSTFAISSVFTLALPYDSGISADLFIATANSFKSTALQYSPTLSNVSYTRTVTRNTSRAPLTYYYKHAIRYHITSTRSTLVNIYQTEDLI